MPALPIRHGFAGAAFAICFAVAPVTLQAQLDFGDNSNPVVGTVSVARRSSGPEPIAHCHFEPPVSIPP
jgi:hypothetical protein